MTVPKKIKYAAIFLLPIALVTGYIAIQEVGIEEPDREWLDNVEDQEPEIATLAGGCFWCTEAIYLQEEGVERAISGYAGGSEETANYQQVISGTTEHREAVRLKYYPEIISYEEILDLYWRSIDPTDDGGQFVDRGSHYTTAIYYHNEEQEEIARETKQNVSDRIEEEIVTDIEEYDTFFRAEDRHQNYSIRNSARYEAYKRGSGRSSTLDQYWEDHPF